MLHQFENIFVLNMPSRSDKLDAMKVTASLTDFDFEIIDGVNGKDVPKKALSGVSETHIIEDKHHTDERS